MDPQRTQIGVECKSNWRNSQSFHLHIMELWENLDVIRSINQSMTLLTCQRYLADGADGAVQMLFTYEVVTFKQ